MKVEYINPFLTSTISAFDMMLGWALIRGEPFIKNGHLPEQDVSGVIGLSGKTAQGMVVLSLSRQAALSVTTVLLEKQMTQINAEVTDAVGELANVVAGGAKAQLESLEMSVSLPTVVVGKNHCLEFPSAVTPICIPFTCELGKVTVQVGLTVKSTATAGAASRT